MFPSYVPCSSYQKVKIAYGSLSSIVGKGSICISKDLILNSVLHVLTFSCNCISISNLTRDLNCMSKFFPTPSEFQELCTSKRIGNAKEVDSLFILEEEPKNVEKAP